MFSAWAIWSRHDDSSVSASAAPANFSPAGKLPGGPRKATPRDDERACGQAGVLALTEGAAQQNGSALERKAPPGTKRNDHAGLWNVVAHRHQAE